MRDNCTPVRATGRTATCPLYPLFQSSVELRGGRCGLSEKLDGTPAEEPMELYSSQSIEYIY